MKIFHFGFCNELETHGSEYAYTSTVSILGIQDNIQHVNVTTSHIPTEQPLLVSFNTSETNVAIWILDSCGKPYQIAGPDDMLMDGGIIIDHTSNYLESWHSIYKIIAFALKSLSINELEKYESILKLWIAEERNKCLAWKCNWKECKSNSIKSLQLLDMPDSAKERMLNSIRKVASPSQKTLHKTIDINLIGYPEFTIFRN